MKNIPENIKKIIIQKRKIVKEDSAYQIAEHPLNLP